MHAVVWAVQQACISLCFTHDQANWRCLNPVEFECGIENGIKDVVYVWKCLWFNESEHVCWTDHPVVPHLCPSDLVSIWVSENDLSLTMSVFFYPHILFSHLFSLPLLSYFLFHPNTPIFSSSSCLSFLLCFHTGSSFFILLSGCWGLQFLAVPISLNGCLTLVESREH